MLVYLLLFAWCQLHVQGQLDSSAECSGDEFLCQSTGVCIAQRLVCDGNPDCSQAEDEAVCSPPTCFLDQFRCSSGSGAGGGCVSLGKVCDGIPDCEDEIDEASCSGTTPGSECEANEFSCSVNGPCVPLAFLCNGVGDCPNSDDESRCERSEVEARVSNEMPVMAGDTITLSCDAIGYPPPFVTWRRNLMPIQRNSRYNFTSRSGFGVLRISNAGQGDAGEYHCEVISELHGSRLIEPSIQVQVTDASPAMCLDHSSLAYPEGTYYYDVLPVGVGPASQAAADIVFVVDESGSMAMEHEWIREEVGILDQLLRDRGVGAGQRENLFALVGFARNDPTAILGITLTDLASPSEFIAASANLELTGSFEDGYAALDYALENIVTRPDTAKQMILITDEDRGVLRLDLSRDVIQTRLREAGYVLNVAVNQGFETDSFDFALGVSSEVTYLFNSSASTLFYELNGNNVMPSTIFRFGNTFEDYVELALGLGGAAWDLNQLREQGSLARAFTNAFSEAKVEEVMTVFRYCFECLCRFLEEVCSLAPNVSVENCSGTFPVLESAITPETAFAKIGSDVTFECLAFTNVDNLSISYEWSYPPRLEPWVTVEGRVLRVLGVNSSAEVNYTCRTTLEGTALADTASSTLVIDTRCQLPDWSYLILGDMRRVVAPQSSNISRAADIVLLVDESGSMVEEHAWIPSMTTLLDQALRAVDVGVEPRNRFGVLGFGDDCNEENIFGRILLSSVQEQFAFADNITDFTGGLNVGGRQEDGYSAIDIALESYDFRDVAKQFILITDEDRDVVAEHLTRDSVQTLLEDVGILLNAAISEEFKGDSLRALGIDGQGNAYVYDPSIRALFEVLEGSGASVPDSAYGSTSTDYTQLALELGGAAWDLSQLRQGGGVAEAFTNAFVQVKVLEIQSQLSRCLNCTCSIDGPVCNVLPNANFSFCMRIPDAPGPGEEPLAVTIVGPVEVTILPSETRSFTCRSNSSAVIRWTFNGGNLPSNTRVLGTGGYKSVLVIDAVLPSNAGVYSCLSHSQSGAFSDSASILTLFYDPGQDLMLVLSPLQTVVTRGNNATVSCTVQSPSIISWLFNNGPLPLNSVVSVPSSTASELTLVSVEDENAGAYTCIANSSSRNVVNDDTAYVEVVDPRLKLLVDADIVTVQEGALVELSCQADCFCPEVVPEWSREDDALLPDLAMILTSDEALGTLSVLQIPMVFSEDGGRYLCSAELNGSTVTVEAYLNVIEEEGFEVIVLGSPQVEIMEGDSHSVVCQANQNASSITWIFNGTTIQVQGSEDEQGDQPVLDNVVAIEVSQLRTVLSILEATALNSGSYQCMAVSDAGEVDMTDVDISVQAI